MEEEPGLSYSKVAALKSTTENALLVDAGDHLQGTAYGGMDNGATIIQLMNAAGYDAATLGNHEFDYGMAGCLSAIDAAAYPYVSCNFRHEKDGVAGELVLDSFVMLESGGKKIAFVGITTPETITSSSLAYYQDEQGNYIYGVDGGSDGSALYAAVETDVAEAKSAGADYVIVLGHLGVDASPGPWTSRNVIANTTGLDAVIDGHSHTTIEMETVTDRGGDSVILTQTGSYLDALEWGSKGIIADGSGENGSLLHVSGLKYTLDLSQDSTVQFDDKDVWTGPPTGEYRVKDVQVLNQETGTYEPLDLTATYNLAGYNYTLRDLGGGFAMLNGAVNVLDYVAEDYMVLANYIQSFPVEEATGLPTITAESGYEDVTGSGRITVGFE